MLQGVLLNTNSAAWPDGKAEDLGLEHGSESLSFSFFCTQALLFIQQIFLSTYYVSGTILGAVVTKEKVTISGFKEVHPLQR